MSYQPQQSSYRPGREIARGGMGAVLDARDQKLGRSVAMKVMLHRDTSEANKQRFRQEARVLGQLAHPNIVPIHDLGTDGLGRLFYTMKLVQGDTLHEVLGRLREGDKATIAKYPLSHLLVVFQKVCDAMAFAHSRGLLHRDLKPQNIMVGEFGEVLVMDWGLAKILPGSPAAQPLSEPEPGGWLAVGGAELEKTLFTEPGNHEGTAMESLTPLPSTADDLSALPLPPSSVQLTLEGAVMGTPQFMSPEQANGELAKLDERSDVYALGAILYSVLTLRPPVEGDDLRQLIARARNPKIIAPITVAETQREMLNQASEAHLPPPIDAVALRHCPAGEVPAALSAVSMKALCREQSARYQSVAELLRDIAAYQQGFATSAENADALTLVRLFVQRHRALAAAAVLVLLVIVVALPLVMSAERKATKNAQLAGVKEQEANQSAATARENALRAEAHAKQAKVSETRAEQEKEIARRALAEAKTALAETHIRDSDVAAARRLLGQVPEDLRDSNWTYLLARTDTSLATFRSFNTEHILRVAAIPTKPGAFAMLGADLFLATVDARSGQRTNGVQLGKPTSSGYYLLAVSPDGGEIAVANETLEAITFYRPGRTQPLRSWKTQRPLSVDFSPTERTVLVVPLPSTVGSKELWLHDADTGEVKWKFDTGSAWNHAVFHPNGKSVIVTYGNDRACLLHAATGQRLRDLPSTVSGAQHVTASPDGTMYAVGDLLGTVRVFNLIDYNLQLAFRASEGSVQQLLFTKESQRIVTIGANPISRVNEVRCWSVASGYPIQNLLGGAAQPFRAALHPISGELIVAGPVAKSWDMALVSGLRG